MQYTVTTAKSHLPGSVAVPETQVEELMKGAIDGGRGGSSGVAAATYS